MRGPAACPAAAPARGGGAPRPAGAAAAAPLPLELSEEVAAALRTGTPVVALESTIISHGMPYPQNVQTAVEVEGILRAQGVTPATIGILEGRIHVGMERAQLDRLGQLGLECKKVSRRDLASVVGARGNGATTVSATMLLAHHAGIPLFVTGGIGGAHRGAAETWDVSADLTELGRTPVCVVCAGAKSILDLPKTLEYLETQGVPVVGYGTSDFPAFFTPSSGLPASCRVDGPAQAAGLLEAQRRLGLGGVVIGVPVPAELAAEAEAVERATAQLIVPLALMGVSERMHFLMALVMTPSAVRESEEKGIKGFEVTPYLLARINELTGGESLRANIALVKNNVSVGGAIARAWAELRAAGGPSRL